jgi:hypothetical protein
MRNKDSGARTGLALAIPARCLFYPHFSTVCVEGGGLPDSSLTGPIQSQHSYSATPTAPVLTARAPRTENIGTRNSSNTVCGDDHDQVTAI